jgi:uncharacterized protein
MLPENVAVLSLLIFAAAILYSSVGHGGASGYLAAMALCGVAPSVMKPTALVLNILVASIGTVQFARAGCFSFSLFWPFAVASVPLAFVGGAIALPGNLYRPAVGLMLFFAAYRLVRATRTAYTTPETRPVPLAGALASGAGIGLLSGLTGTGGGIFLSPLLIIMNWAGARESAGVSAAFILFNSISGLAGHLTGVARLPASVPVWAAAAVAGGLIGSSLGSRRLGNRMLKRLLAAVLVVAGAKLILTA